MTTLAELMVDVGIDADDLGTGVDQAVDKAERSLGRLDDAAGRAGAAVDDAGDRAARAFSGVENDVNRASAALRDVGDDAGRAAAEMQGAGRRGGDGFVSGVTSAMGSLGGSLSSSASSALDDLKGELAVGGIAAGAVLVGAMLEGVDRERAGDQLAARLDLSAQQSEAFGRAAGNLYAGAWGDSMGHVTEALDAVHSSLAGSLGPADDALERTTAKALDLAAGFGVDVVESAGVAGFAVRHGLARDADHAFDLIISAMQRMPASMREELFPAIEEYGSFLANLGFTGEEAFGLLAAASQEGSFGIDKTADALKELTIRATDMSATSVAAFEAAGLNAEDMAARFLAGGDSAKGALDELVAGLLGIEDPVARSNAAIGLFGTPLEDLSVTEIPAFLDSLDGIETSLGDVGGKAEEFGDKLNDNLATRMESVKRRGIDALAKAAEQTLLPALEAVIGFAEDHPMAFQVMTVGVFALAAGFMALAVAAAVATIAAAPWIATALLVAGVVAALILVIGLLIIFWDEVKMAAAAAWDWIKEKASQAFNWIKENWPLILGIMTGPIGLAVLAITRNWDKIKSGASAVKDWIVARFGDVVSFVRGLPGRVASAASGMFDGIKNAFKSAINAIIRMWNGISFPSLTIGGQDPLGSFGPSLPEVTIGGWELPNIPELAGGAMVRATPGGTLARIGEGRHDEAVVPLPRGMRSIEGGGVVTVNQTIMGSIRSDKELVALVRDELNLGGLRGAIR